MIFRNFTFSILFAVAILACENEPPESIGEVRCTVTSTQNTAYNNALVFARGYIHLNRVEVSGRKNGQEEAATADFHVPEQFFFIGEDLRQPIKVPIAEASDTTPFYAQGPMQQNFKLFTPRVFTKSLNMYLGICSGWPWNQVTCQK